MLVMTVCLFFPALPVLSSVQTVQYLVEGMASIHFSVSSHRECEVIAAKDLRSISHFR